MTKPTRYHAYKGTEISPTTMEESRAPVINIWAEKTLGIINAFYFSFYSFSQGNNISVDSEIYLNRSGTVVDTVLVCFVMDAWEDGLLCLTAFCLTSADLRI
jgi:hypothetical protein